MKKNYFFITALMFVVITFMPTSTNAQTKIGIQGGFTSSEFHANGESSNSGTGIKLGLLGDFSISENFLFETGIGYTQKNSGKDYTNCHYLEAPVNIKYLFPISEKIDVVGLGGTYLGYLLSAKEDGESIDIESKHRFDYGLAFGAGVKFGNFQILSAYQLGLKKFNYDVKLNTISVSLAYFF